jgi:hypothetical protein
MDVVEWSRALDLRLKRLVLQCINGVSSNQGEGRIYDVIKQYIFPHFIKQRRLKNQ